MAKQVVWSHRAQEDRKNILNYRKQRNGSITYSKKLNHLFKEAIRLLKNFPQVGKLTDQENVRVKIVRDYLIIYEVTETTIYILTIWDSRQDPEKLKKIFM